jgi:mono/diheme cytochrome c family protein
MKRWLIRIALGIPLTVVALLAGLLGYAQYSIGRELDVPYPHIKADTSAAGIARGAAIFHANCETCHLDRASNRAAGQPLREIPEFLGTFASANITAHPTAGIGRLTDAQVARQIRYAVNHENRFTIMPSSAMSDADLAAVVGFLRSGDPLFAPSPKVNPKSRISAAGKLIGVTSGAFAVAKRPATIVAPPKAANAAWGRYLVENVHDCSDCHTDGFDPQRKYGPTAYAGGGEMRDASNQPIYPPNITFHATGLAGWTKEDLGTALREGIRKDGTILRAPMIRFRSFDDTDVAAVYAFLQSVPKRPSVVKVARTAAPPAPPHEQPSQMFARLGCVSCHAPGAQYHDRLAQARGKDVVDVARWIRHPEQFRPGTPMPTYAKLLGEDDAVRLAAYVQSLSRPTSVQAALTQPAARGN